MAIRERDGTIREQTLAESAREEALNTLMLEQATEEQTLQELRKLDMESIRSIREHLASQVPRLAEIEQRAETERAKLLKNKNARF